MTTKRSRLLLGFSCSFLLSSLAHAQAVFRDEAVRVFAERAPLLDRMGTQSIEVLDRAAIEARNPASVLDLLRDLAGVHVDRLGNAGGSSNAYIRGSDPNHVVVLVDGVRMNDPTDARGGGFDFAGIALAEVERIEVLRGAGSAQFGADAMGGVINVVTRSEARARAELAGGLGGGGLREGSILGSSGVASAGAAVRRDGLDEEGGHALRRFGWGAIAWDGADGSRVRLRARRASSASASYPEASGGVRLAVTRELERRDRDDTLGAASLEGNLGGGWRAALRASATKSDEDARSPAIAPGPGGLVPATREHTRFERRTTAASLSRTGLPGDSQLAGGVEWMQEDGERRSVLQFGPAQLPSDFDLARRTQAFFVEANSAPLRNVGIALAARHDRVDPGPGNTSRSAGVRYALDDRQALRAHWSEGFKLPSFYALGDTLVGNPGLRPETSRGRELGYEWRSSFIRASATGFETRYESLIDFDPATFHMVNRDGARVRGAEMQATARLPGGVEVGAAYTYIDARLFEQGAVLRNRPRHRGSVLVDHAVGPWATHLALRYVGRSNDFSVPTGDVQLGGFTTADASVAWGCGVWRIALAVDNLANRAAESFVGFTAPRRRARLAVTLVLR